MKTANLIILLCCSFFIFHCNKSPIEIESETKPFLNTLWTLQSFDIEGIVVRPPNIQLYTIQFQEDSTFSGKIRCNTMRGKYEILLYNSFIIDVTHITKLYCGEESMDEMYFKALEISEFYEINKNKLCIYYSDNSKLNFIGE